MYLIFQSIIVEVGSNLTASQILTICKIKFEILYVKIHFQFSLIFKEKNLDDTKKKILCNFAPTCDKTEVPKHPAPTVWDDNETWEE